jgi:hypothetical protein
MGEQPRRRISRYLLVGLVPLSALLSLALSCRRDSHREREPIVVGGEPIHAVERAVVKVPRPPLEDGLFPVAHVRTRQKPEPPLFTAELPQNRAAFTRAWAGYPAVHIKKRLCAADPATIARFERAVAAAAGSDSGADLRKTYGSLLDGCERPPMCQWANETVRTGAPAAAAAWVGLANCGREAAPLFERDDAPAEATVGYWANLEWRDESFVPRFLPNVAASLRTVALAGDPMLTRFGSLFLAKTHDPRATAALLHLHDELPAGKVRDEVAAAMGDTGDPRARARFAEYCDRRRNDPVCAPDAGETASLGASAAKTPPAPPTSPALAGRLRAAGLLWRGPLDQPAPSAPSGETADEILAVSGPVHCFDVETGSYPNEHDGLLYDLAELAGPPLGDASFQEDAPPVELRHGRWLLGHGEVDRLPPGVTPGAPYKLQAYLSGRAYEVEAQDFGDWFDLEQVLGLLNAISADRGAETRLVALAGDGQIACVLAAPRKAIRSAVQAGLLKVGSAASAAEKGKAFEEKVLKQMTGEESPP